MARIADLKSWKESAVQKRWKTTICFLPHTARFIKRRVIPPAPPPSTARPFSARAATPSAASSNAALHPFSNRPTSVGHAPPSHGPARQVNQPGYLEERQGSSGILNQLLTSRPKPAIPTLVVGIEE